MSSPFDTSRISLQFRDLKTHHIPRLSTLKSNQLLQQYEQEINQLLEDLRLNIQELELEIQDLEGGRKQKERATLQVDGLKNDWQKARGATRNALLNARRSIKTAMEQEARSELNLDNVSGIIGKQRRNNSRSRGDGGDDNIHTASQDVTTALERTLGLLSQELEKSSFSSQLLDESSQSLTSISLEYTSFSSLIKSSTHLIKTMERADFYDRLMVFASFAFFLLCVGYILKRRIWDNGISILSFIFGLLTFWRKKGSGVVGGEKLIKGSKDLLMKGKGNVKGKVEKVVEDLVTTSLASIASKISLDYHVDPTPTTLGSLGESLDGVGDEDGVGERLGLDLGSGSLSRLNTRPTERIEL